MWRAPGDFAAAIAAAGLGSPEIIPDGEIHRFHVEGDASGTKNGWFSLHLDGCPTGAYGTWKANETLIWCAVPRAEQTPEQRASVRATIERAKAQRQTEEAAKHADGARRAGVIWDRAKPADLTHPYLLAKGIKAHGIRQDGSALVVPVMVDGALSSLQSVLQDGTKRFLAGGRMAGGCYLLDDATNRSEVLIAEGFATGATLHEQIGAKVYVAFTAGNLTAVAQYVRELHPDETIILCADHDQWTEGNPGLTAARAAAAQIGAKLLIPDFTGLDLTSKSTDFNDLVRLAGGLPAGLLEGAVDPQPGGLPPPQPDDPGPSDYPPGPDVGDPAPATEHPPSRLRRCDLSKLHEAELRAPTFVIEPLIPRGYLTLFGGHGGSGKSVLALVLAAHVACGRSWAGLSITTGRVLFVSFEDGEDLVLWRLRRIAEEYALNFGDIERGLTVIDATSAAAIMFEVAEGGVKKVLPTADGEELHALILADQYDLVVIDNASDAFDGDENHRRQVRTFVHYVGASVRPHNGAVLLLAHIDKNAARYGSAKNSYSGSTGWHNSARSRLALTDDELRQEKLNVGKALEAPIPIAWTNRAVPVPAGHKGAATAQASVNEADDAALLACFGAAAQAGRTVPSADTGPATTWHVFAAFPELPKHLKDNKPRFREGIARLLRTGRVRSEAYVTDNRKHRERLILAVSVVAPMRANVEPAHIGADQHTPCAINAQGGVGGIGANLEPEQALAQTSAPGPADDDPEVTL
jgi:putative DNA primase/helicase